MKAELPEPDQDRMLAPHAQEIEYALILQRMINTVDADPAQRRLAIYEYARARLKLDTSWAEKPEQERMLIALETAIRGVEQFSLRRDEPDRLTWSPSAQLGQRPEAASVASDGEEADGEEEDRQEEDDRQESASPSPPIGQGRPPTSHLATLTPLDPADQDIIIPTRVYAQPEIRVVEVHQRAQLLTAALLGAVLLGFAAVATISYLKQQPALSGSVAHSAKLQDAPNAPASAAAPAGPANNAPGFPLPSDYGIYALSNDALSELSPLPERVPDKRIAISTPVSQLSRTTLNDGKVRFVLFRRDLIGNAPQRVEVRVVARVVRALTFDAKGKPSLNPVSDAWNVRNISYEFRVRPIAGSPEMLLVQSDKPDFELPSGRYILVLGEQGYDFTIAGKVTDLAQCLERTDAANGAFYSECQNL